MTVYSRTLRDEIEIRIARGWSHHRIARELGVPVEKVDECRWAMLDDREGRPR